MLAPAAILGLLAPLALGRAVGEKAFGCGAPEPSEQQLEVAKILGAQEREMNAFGLLDTGKETITVDTYFHVVSISEDPEEGYLTVRLSSRSLSKDESEK